MIRIASKATKTNVFTLCKDRTFFIRQTELPSGETTDRPIGIGEAFQFYLKAEVTICPFKSSLIF